MSELRKLPKKCPACGSAISLGKATQSGTIGWSCSSSKCSAFSFADGCEHPDIAKGKKLAKEFKDVPVMDKKMTSLPTFVQLGILRVNQHPHDEWYGSDGTTFIDPADGKRKKKPHDHSCEICQ